MLPPGQLNSGPFQRIGSGGGGSGSSLLSMPDAALDNVLWVQQTSSVYAADGSAQYPYTSIDDAINAAAALLPTASNPVAIVALPGEYDEQITLDEDFVFLFGWDRETTILTHATTPVDFRSEYTGIHGMTIRTPSATPIMTVSTGTVAVMPECVECTFDLYGAVDPGGGAITLTSSALRLIDCKILSDVTTNDTLVLQTASVCELWDCSVEGTIVQGQTDDLYLHRCTLDDGRVDCGSTGALFVFDSTIITAGGSAIDLSASTQLVVKDSYLSSQAANKDINATAVVAGVVVENTVMMADGMDENVQTVNPIKYVGAAGNKDFYLTTQEAITSIAFDDCTVKLLKDETTAASLTPVARPFTIDGNGKHAITRLPIGTTLTTLAASILRFRDVMLSGRLTVAASGGTLLLEDCELDGDIFVVGGDATTTVGIYDSRLVGNGTFLRPLLIQRANVVIKVLRSYVKGHTGQAAIYWAGGITSNDLRISYSTIWHGSGAGNNPFGANAAQTPNWVGAHNTFNTDPDAPAGPPNWTNLVAAGQQQTTFDVNTDY